ncbi:hypothetical protein AB0H36_28810 [Kribbella sp. NPDC050820]
MTTVRVLGSLELEADGVEVVLGGRSYDDSSPPSRSPKVVRCRTTS